MSFLFYEILTPKAGHLLIAFNYNGKSFFVSGKWILNNKYTKCSSGFDCVNSKLIIKYKLRLFYL